MGCRFTPLVRLQSPINLLGCQGVCGHPCTPAGNPLPPMCLLLASSSPRSCSGALAERHGSVSAVQAVLVSDKIMAFSLHIRGYCEKKRTPENVENWSSPAASSTNAAPHMSGNDNCGALSFYKRRTVKPIYQVKCILLHT